MSPPGPDMLAATLLSQAPCTLHVQTLSAKMSGRIMKAARDQQEEIDAEEQEHEGQERVQVRAAGHRAQCWGCCSAGCMAVWLPCPVLPCLADWLTGAGLHPLTTLNVVTPLCLQISAGALAAALQKMKDSDDEGDDEDEDLGGGYDADSIYGAEDVSPPCSHCCCAVHLAPLSHCCSSPAPFCALLILHPSHPSRC